MSEFEVGGKLYATKPMDVMTQFHVGRKLAPGLFRCLGELRTTGETMLDSIEPMLETISLMSKGDSEYIIFSCLATCQRKNSGIYSNLTNGTSLMFDDVGLDDMLKIVWNVIQDTFKRFFPVRQDSPAADAQAQS
jgi:hypothetical protein